MSGLAMILQSLGGDHRQIIIWMWQQLPLHTFVNNSNKSYKVIAILCYSHNLRLQLLIFLVEPYRKS